MKVPGYRQCHTMLSLYFEQDKVKESGLFKQRRENTRAVKCQIFEFIQKITLFPHLLKGYFSPVTKGNLTSEIVAEVRQLGRQQQEFITDVQQLKLYTESVISTKEEKGKVILTLFKDVNHESSYTQLNSIQFNAIQYLIGKSTIIK